MRLANSPAPWPPDVGHEISSVLEDRARGRLRRSAATAHRLSLSVAFAELQAWLSDGRAYDLKYHKRPWATMAEDVARTLGRRGPKVVNHTPSFGALATELGLPNLGADSARRVRCRSLMAHCQSELGQSATRVAAFDDLVDAAMNTATSWYDVCDRVEIVEECLRFAGLGFRSLFQEMAGVLDNNLWAVKVAEERLGGSEAPEYGDIAEESSLTVQERVDLCRKLLMQPDVPHRHVIWFCYDEARIRKSSITFGPVTFFDGKELISAINNSTSLYHEVQHPDGSFSYEETPLPAEVSQPEGRPVVRDWIDWPPRDLVNWVAVRVDLGSGTYVDPVGTAMQQADSLVRLAAFHGGGSSWRRLSGYQHIRDGHPGGGSVYWDLGGRGAHVDHDDTDLIMGDLSRELAQHLPIQDPHLQDLLDAAAVLDGHSDDLDSLSILHSVRVIERIANLCGKSWSTHLIENFSVQWARDVVFDVVGEVIRDIDNHSELRGYLTSVPSDKVLYTMDSGWRDLNREAAVAAIPLIAAELPVHHPVARFVRTVADKTATPKALSVWITEYSEVYKRLIHRLVRCRNSLAHGGPFNNGTAVTVHNLARAHAKRTTSWSLWAVVGGTDIVSEHAQRKGLVDKWRDGIAAIQTAAEAFR